MLPKSDGEPLHATQGGIEYDRNAADPERQGALLRANELFLAAMLDASLDSIITIDRDSRIVEWNGAAEATFGHRRSSVIGQDMTDLIVPEELRASHRAGMAHFLRTGEGPVLGRRVEIEAIRADGMRFPIELAISPIRISGAAYFTAFIRDITDRRLAERSLRESEQRLRATYENAFAAIGEVDPKGHFLRVNEQFCSLTGYTRDELLGLTLFDITHPEDRERDRQLFQLQMTAKLDAYRLEKRYVHKNGAVIWIKVSASTVHDASGAVLYGVRVIDDITEQKNAERHQALLVNELNHRVKNTLAVVQSIASQTLRGAGVPRAVMESLEGRLSALARAHDILTTGNWDAADLGSLVWAALHAHDGDPSPFRLTGPSLRLGPKMALAVSMMFHELATNAAKYGALSSSAGTVSVSWERQGTAKAPRLCMAWRESGGPAVNPPARKGFGSRLIQSLSAELGADIELSYDPGGFRCALDAPLEGGSA